MVGGYHNFTIKVTPEIGNSLVLVGGLAKKSQHKSLQIVFFVGKN